MPYKRLSILPAVALAVAVFSSPVASPCAAALDSQVTAKSVTHLLEQHYRHVNTLEAVFLQRYTEGPREARVESGIVYFKHPGRMRWEYQAPEKKLFVSDGKTVWFYVPYDHTVTKTPVKESSDWRTPLALLTGKVELSRLCDRVDLIQQSGVPSGHVVLRCLPKGQEESQAKAKAAGPQPVNELPGAAPFTDVLLEVDAATGELERIDVRQPGEIQMEYRFAKWQTDIPLADDLFRFHVPLGVAVVDGAALTGHSK